MPEEAQSAQVVIVDEDVAEFARSVHPAEVAEGESARVTVAITNGLTFQNDQEIALGFSESAATKGEDFTVSSESLRLRAGARTATETLTATVDQEEEGAETVTITALHGGAEIGSATVTIAAIAAPPPLTAEFLGLPAAHDGEAAFLFELRFSEEVSVGYRTLRDAAFEGSEGSVTQARRLVPRSNRHWEITVQPTSEAHVVLALPVTTDCAAEGAVCTAAGGGLSQRVGATVKGPSEVEAAGFPLARENSRPSGLWSDGETA